MKKIWEVGFLIMASLLYLIIITEGLLKIEEVVHLLELFLCLLKIVLSVGGMVLVINNLKMNVNNKANFMAVSTFDMGILLLFQLYIVYKNSMPYTDHFLEWGINCTIAYFQITSLIIYLSAIDEQKSIFKWRMRQKIFVIGIGGLLGILSHYIRKFHDISIIFYMLHVLQLGTILGCIRLNTLWQQAKSKVELEAYLYIKRLIEIQWWIIFAAFLRPIIKQDGYHLVLMLSQFAFQATVYFYIKEMTLSVTWHKIERKLENRKQEVIEGNMQQQLLNLAIENIQGIIQKISCQASCLIQKGQMQDEVRYEKYFLKIQDNALRLKRLMGNIVDLDTLEKSERNYECVAINLSQLIRKLVDALEPYIRDKGMHISITISQEEIIGYVDEEAMERVFFNIISNAIKYNKPNGRIQVTLSENKRNIFLAIQDTGVGMSSEALNSVFKKYERFSSRYGQQQEGSGLGLFIVKHLVEKQSGEIKIASKEGKGTIVSIILPQNQAVVKKWYEQEQAKIKKDKIGDKNIKHNI